MAAPTPVATIPANATPTANWTSPGASSTRSTNSFSVTTGDILVFVSATEDGQHTIATPTGGGLTWAQQAQLGTAAANCRAAIYTTTATATTSITVSSTTGGTNHSWGFRIFQFRDSDGIGTVASSASGSTVAPSQAITTTQDNSALVYVGADWTSSDGTTRTWRTINSVTPTSGNGLETDYYRDAGGTIYAVYTGYWDDAGTAGAKTVGLTTPTQKATIVVLEIKGIGAVVPFDPTYIDWPLRQPHPKMRGAA
jgi:hypothetical protein